MKFLSFDDDNGNNLSHFFYLQIETCNITLLRFFSPKINRNIHYGDGEFLHGGNLTFDRHDIFPHGENLLVLI